MASEHKASNGVNNAEPKDVIIEPDGPSVVSKDDDDSKVKFQLFVETFSIMELFVFPVHVAR